MKTNQADQYFYTADYYSYTLLTSADGTVTQRKYSTIPSQVKLALTVNLFGELAMLAETKMQLDGYLKNVLDKNGDEIYEGGVWKIIATAPLLGPFGIKSGYQYRAEIIEGQI